MSALFGGHYMISGPPWVVHTLEFALGVCFLWCFLAAVLTRCTWRAEPAAIQSLVHRYKVTGWNPNRDTHKKKIKKRKNRQRNNSWGSWEELGTRGRKCCFRELLYNIVGQKPNWAIWWCPAFGGVLHLWPFVHWEPPYLGGEGISSIAPSRFIVSHCFVRLSRWLWAANIIKTSPCLTCPSSAPHNNSNDTTHSLRTCGRLSFTTRAARVTISLRTSQQLSLRS